jgi:hypothetical protein
VLLDSAGSVCSKKPEVSEKKRFFNKIFFAQDFFSPFCVPIFLFASYEIWKVLVSLVTFFLPQIFTFYEFYASKNQLSRGVAGVAGVVLNLYRRYLSRLKCYSIDITDTLHHLSWIDALHTQNLDILKSLEKTQELKKSH